jgi:hypothetical protein
VPEVLKRIKHGPPRNWGFGGKLSYLLMCLAFRRIYGGQGMAADGVRRKRLGTGTRLLSKTGIAIYNHYFRKQLGGRVGHQWSGTARPAEVLTTQVQTQSAPDSD